MSSGGRQTALGERYAGHNRARGRGFIYGGGERTEALRTFLRIPGDGLVLDLCRSPQEFVAEVARVLRPGGTVVGSVPNAFRLRNRLVFASGRWFEADPTHLRQFSAASLRDLLERRVTQVQIRPSVGRFAGVWPRMFGNDLVWTRIKA